MFILELIIKMIVLQLSMVVPTEFHPSTLQFSWYKRTYAIHICDDTSLHLPRACSFDQFVVQVLHTTSKIFML